MFLFTFLIGIYSYIIFTLGIFGLLHKTLVIGIIFLFWGSVLVWKRNVIPNLFRNLKRILKRVQDDNKLNKLLLFFGFLLLLQAGVNFIGVLGSELGFDALWYHLTLPKIYQQNHSVDFISGGLLYYSAMPKLTEMLYVAGLSFGNETIPKLIHFSFGLLTCFAIYKLSRKFFTPLISLIAVIIFYSNLVVAWESITAYVDLVRVFFEVMALWAFINWLDSQKRKWLNASAIMLGLAITTKVLAIGSLVIFIILIIFKSWKRLLRFARNDVVNILVFIFVSLTIPLPWFVFSYINTGNPVYPFFTDIYPVTTSSSSFIGFFRDVWGVFMYSPDPINPIYMMFLPIGIWLLVRSRNKFGVTKIDSGQARMTTLRVIGIYSLLAVIVWYFTPRTGGGRFILPYLPAFSIICAAIINEIIKNKKQYSAYLGKFLLVVVVCISLISIVYRFAANYKYLPVIFGAQTKAEFLTNHLNFSYGDFYDVDGYFKENIKYSDTVLLYGFHNLYYVNFPFIDSSWLKDDDEFNYIATQNADLPEEFSNWILVYENKQTMVKLYKK